MAEFSVNPTRFDLIRTSSFGSSGTDATSRASAKSVDCGVLLKSFSIGKGGIPAVAESRQAEPSMLRLRLAWRYPRPGIRKLGQQSLALRRRLGRGSFVKRLPQRYYPRSLQRGGATCSVLQNLPLLGL